ncbi:hypothetical protein BDV93DRAFT_510243 [Ceratobasidium sp. AG-I]|nr:hypothetical protein BDV93DRAFT_510243 [Ceratobasidium sp. AG-I]
MPPSRTTQPKKRVLCSCKCKAYVTLATETSHLQFRQHLSQNPLPNNLATQPVVTGSSHLDHFDNAGLNSGTGPGVENGEPNELNTGAPDLPATSEIDWAAVLQSRILGNEDQDLSEDEDPPDENELDGHSDESLEDEPCIDDVVFSRHTINMRPEDLLRESTTVNGTLKSM